MLPPGTNSAGADVCLMSLRPRLTAAAQRTIRRTNGLASQRMCAMEGVHQVNVGSGSVQINETCCGTRTPRFARNCWAAANKGASSTINAVGGVTFVYPTKGVCGLETFHLN